MNIIFDYHSSEPLLRQAVLQIKRLRVVGELKPGDKLPSVRQLAKELQINPTTAARIFAQLAKEGIVVQKPGLGVFISDAPCPFSPEYIDTEISRQALALLIDGFSYGLKYQQILGILEKQKEWIVNSGECEKKST